jgi:hypothetical protein
METGTEILIARMASHPEEFVEGALNKWTRVMDMANGCLPEEDLQALGNAYKKAKIERFNGEVLATLAGERELLTVPENTVRYQAKERYSTGWADPRSSQARAVEWTNPMESFGQSALINPAL